MGGGKKGKKKDKNKNEKSAEQIMNQIKKIEKNLDAKASIKTCMKDCNNLIKRNPNSGELLALKGVIYNNQPIGEEETFELHQKRARKLLKDSIVKNMSSSYCWRKQGILLASHRDYSGAIKSFKKAQQLDPTIKLNCLYDISLCQAMLQDYKSLVDYRRQILTEHQRNNAKWHAFA